MSIQRFSSRRQPIDQDFLLQRLQGARSYDRIAGYFSSSILDLTKEVLGTVNGPIRIICNSDLDTRDVAIAHAAMRKQWCAQDQQHFAMRDQSRFAVLYHLLISHKMEIKVLPSTTFGLEHGKAGVITLANGTRTAFVGSANETFPAWKQHYELVWEDTSSEAVHWVQEEFDALWHCPLAVFLADFIIEDIGRLGRRTVLPSVEVWRQHPDPAAPLIEMPIYRREDGLWEHQKFFIQLAFQAHCSSQSARFLLADMVGLGKTVQLALAALLMALYGEKPILILCPHALIWQWQMEMKSLLDMPSAVWTGRTWVDEQGFAFPQRGLREIQHCPRRIGIVSDGLITSGSEASIYLEQIMYECVIVDEAHRARRRNGGMNGNRKKADANNLLSFLQRLARQTKSMLLATATPVQISPVEAWDLLNVLATGSDESEHISYGSQFVLGNSWSQWRKPAKALEVVLSGHLPPNADEWEWLRNPLPPGMNDPEMQILRRALKKEKEAIAPGPALTSLDPANYARVHRLGNNLPKERNPFIRHIVRRTRQFLEETINPQTNRPYLSRVNVRLFGEKADEAIPIPSYLESAYEHARLFCQMLANRGSGTSLLQTLLLRRVGSTIYAGQCTARTLLENTNEIDDESEGECFRNPILSMAEQQHLEAFLQILESNVEYDPKYEVVLRLLVEQNWLSRGCIVFSQYLDSLLWLAARLAKNIPQEKIGVYASEQHSFLYQNTRQEKIDRESLKHMVQQGELRLLLGTDAASEGLNLQQLGTLINLDLPWNPTRLEQRKGRIQRIGQRQETVFIYNLRYKGSIEDRVHELLSKRLEDIRVLFGQLPDVLEDVWIQEALDRSEEAKKIIGNIPEKHPFEMKYNQIANVPWESCATVLDAADCQRHLLQGWTDLS